LLACSCRERKESFLVSLDRGGLVEVWIAAVDLSESHVFFPRNGPAALNEGAGQRLPAALGGPNSLNDNFAINVLTLLLSSEKKVFRLNRFQNSHHDSKR
jgi:hypothetical protein